MNFTKATCRRGINLSAIIDPFDDDQT